MDHPEPNPCRIQRNNSVASTPQIPKQYRVLGLASQQSTSTMASSSVTGSTGRARSFAPPPKPLILSDHLSNLIQHITHYFNLFHCLPLTLIDRNLCAERPTGTFSGYGRLETEFRKCLLGLRDTLWCIQTQLKDEDQYIIKIFQGFEGQVKKYLMSCLKGWKGMLLVRSCTIHYHNVCELRRVLRDELDEVREIMDAVGPHCKEMLLNVDVEVVIEWLVNLDETRTLDAEMKEECPRIDGEVGNASFWLEDWEDRSVTSPTWSERSMERLFRHHHCLPTYPFTSNRSIDFEDKKKKAGLRDYLRASLLNWN